MGASVGFTFAPGMRLLEAIDDDAVGRLETLRDHPHRAEEAAELDGSGGDGVVGADHEQKALTLLRADGHVGHEQRS